MNGSFIVDTRKEINPALEHAGDNHRLSADDLIGFPPLACGWVLREYAIENRTLKLVLPHQPDMLLDDPSVRAASVEDDYMPYWAYLWPAALEMSRAVLRANWSARTRVLELGCGLGLAGIAAMAAGCDVTLTDYDAMSVHVASRNAELNGFRNFRSHTLDWRLPPAEQFTVILGCDVTYEQRNHAPILALLQSCLEPGGVCWLADGGRNVSTDFWNLAQRSGFTVHIRDVNGDLIEAPGLHYQLFELRRAS